MRFYKGDRVREMSNTHQHFHILRKAPNIARVVLWLDADTKFVINLNNHTQFFTVMLCLNSYQITDFHYLPAHRASCTLPTY